VSVENNSTRQQQFNEHGVVFPIDVIDAVAATNLIARYEALRDTMAHWTSTSQLLKVHFVSRWAWDLVSHPNLVAPVKELIGPDVLCWGATFFAKPPNTPSYVGWHQDLRYWGLSPAQNVVTAWLALSDAKFDNGCMSVISGSHRTALREHDNHIDGENMLLSGQRISVDEEELAKAIHCELEPGQASIHHSLALHGSQPNTSSRPRIGLSINYISADVVQSQNNGVDSAIPVSGNCERSLMRLEQPPMGEFDDDSIERWKSSISHPSGLGAIAEGVVVSAKL